MWSPLYIHNKSFPYSTIYSLHKPSLLQYQIWNDGHEIRAEVVSFYFFLDLLLVLFFFPLVMDIMLGVLRSIIVLTYILCFVELLQKSAVMLRRKWLNISNLNHPKTKWTTNKTVSRTPHLQHRTACSQKKKNWTTT